MIPPLVIVKKVAKRLILGSIVRKCYWKVSTDGKEADGVICTCLHGRKKTHAGILTDICVDLPYHV